MTRLDEPRSRYLVDTDTDATDTTGEDRIYNLARSYDGLSKLRSFLSDPNLAPNAPDRLVAERLLALEEERKRNLRRFIAPRSPQGLLQEEHADRPFFTLALSMLVGRSGAGSVRPLVEEMLKVLDALNLEANFERIFRPLGLARVKARRIASAHDAWMEECRRFTISYGFGRADDHALSAAFVRKLPGVGPYAVRSYQIFCLGELGKEPPNDRALFSYWLLARYEPEAYARGWLVPGDQGLDFGSEYPEDVDPEVVEPLTPADRERANERRGYGDDGRITGER